MYARTLLLRKHAAATCVQARWRQHIAQCRYEHFRSVRDAAASTVQRAWRRGRPRQQPAQPAPPEQRTARFAEPQPEPSTPATPQPRRLGRSARSVTPGKTKSYVLDHEDEVLPSLPPPAPKPDASAEERRRAQREREAAERQAELLRRANEGASLDRQRADLDRRMADAERRLLRAKGAAATVIQAHWRGFATRRAAMRMVADTSRHAAAAASAAAESARLYGDLLARAQRHKAAVLREQQRQQPQPQQRALPPQQQQRASAAPAPPSRSFSLPPSKEADNGGHKEVRIRVSHKPYGSDASLYPSTHYSYAPGLPGANPAAAAAAAAPAARPAPLPSRGAPATATVSAPPSVAGDSPPPPPPLRRHPSAELGASTASSSGRSSPSGPVPYGPASAAPAAAAAPPPLPAPAGPKGDRVLPFTLRLAKLDFSKVAAAPGPRSLFEGRFSGACRTLIEEDRIRVSVVDVRAGSVIVDGAERGALASLSVQSVARLRQDALACQEATDGLCLLAHTPFLPPLLLPPIRSGHARPGRRRLEARRGPRTGGAGVSRCAAALLPLA